MKKLRLILAAQMFLLSSLVWGEELQNQQTKEFMTACTYGVLAGTLVGAATLAFEKRPGDNLQRVARGASIGLYLGIGLGFYVMYGVPTEEEAIEGQLPPSGSNFKLWPLLSENGWGGFAAQWKF